MYKYSDIMNEILSYINSKQSKYHVLYGTLKTDKDSVMIVNDTDDTGKENIDITGTFYDCEVSVKLFYRRMSTVSGDDLKCIGILDDIANILVTGYKEIGNQDFRISGVSKESISSLNSVYDNGVRDFSTKLKINYFIRRY